MTDPRPRCHHNHVFPLDTEGAGCASCLGVEVERLRGQVADLRSACEEKQEICDGAVRTNQELTALRADAARYRETLESIVREAGYKHWAEQGFKPFSEWLVQYVNNALHPAGVTPGAVQGQDPGLAEASGSAARGETGRDGSTEKGD